MNPYQVLGINKYSSSEEVRLAYKRLMKKHHPDSGDGDTHKLNEAREAYVYLTTDNKQKQDVVTCNVPTTQAELASILGKTKTFETEGIQFEVFVPYETRMNDTITVKDILPNVTLKIKFKEQNE
jgi:preprotein translocase subunit Sec63